MNESQHRIMDTMLEDVLHGREVPDVSKRVAEALAKDPSASIARPAGARGASEDDSVGRVIKRRIGIIAAAASVVIGLAILGYEWFTRPEHPGGVTLSANAEIVRDGETIELARGWALLSDGAPPLKMNGAALKDIHGQALVVAGGMPSDETLSNIQEWLTKNNLQAKDATMITNKKRWVMTGAVAFMLISGDAIYDGERIEAQEEKAKLR